jgi:hypothetical protein
MTIARLEDTHNHLCYGCAHFKWVPACNSDPEYPEAMLDDEDYEEADVGCEDFKPDPAIAWIYGTCNLATLAPLMEIIEGVFKALDNKQYLIEENAISYWLETHNRAQNDAPPWEMWSWSRQHVAPLNIVRRHIV